MTIKTFFSDLEKIMQEEEVRSGLIRVGVYTAGAAVLTAVGVPALAGALDVTSVASIYGANAWAASQYPYLSPDYIAGHIQSGQEIFGHEAFMRYTPGGNGFEDPASGILQQCRDTVTKVRAITPNEVWMRILDTAAYALDRIESVVKPVVSAASDLKETLTARYGATETVIITVASVLALGESIKKNYAKAANFGRRLFGLPEKLSADEQALLDLSNKMMADMAKSQNEMRENMQERVAMMEKQIIETLKEQIRNASFAQPAQVQAEPAVHASQSAEADIVQAPAAAITAEDVFCANMAANTALVGEDAFARMNLVREHAEKLSDKSDSIVWMSNKLHERMSEVAGEFAGRSFDTKKLCGTISRGMFATSGIDPDSILIKAKVTHKFAESGLSGERLNDIRNAFGAKHSSAKIVADMEGFLRALDSMPKQGKPVILPESGRLKKVSIEDASQVPFSIIEGP